MKSNFENHLIQFHALYRWENLDPKCQMITQTDTTLELRLNSRLGLLPLSLLTCMDPWVRKQDASGEYKIYSRDKFWQYSFSSTPFEFDLKLNMGFQKAIVSNLLEVYFPSFFKYLL